jgi:Mrp family chromosome partitioning ATPase
LQVLRTQIEASVPIPGIIMITSAKPSDGGTLAATSLAECLAAAGHRVALVGSDSAAPVRDGVGPPIAQLPFSTLESAGRAANVVEQSALRLRQDFDYTVVDAPPVMDSNVSMRLARDADAVLLSIRVGRMACAEDQSMMESLQLAGARVLGVIGTSDVAPRPRAEPRRPGVISEEVTVRPAEASKTTAPLPSRP